jgi:hypothetical protein
MVLWDGGSGLGVNGVLRNGSCYRRSAPTELGVSSGQIVLQTFRSYGAGSASKWLLVQTCRSYGAIVAP